MSAVLKKWLAGRLGVIYDMRPEFFGAHVSDGIHSSDVFPDVVDHFYRELGCTEEEGPNSCAYDCGIVMHPPDKCLYRGTEYDVDQYLPEDVVEEPCSLGCICQLESDKPTWTCAEVDCPFFSLIADEPGCFLQFDLDNCCPNSSACINETKTCEVDGEIYYEGQYVLIPEDPCISCICDKNYDGTRDSLSCRKTACGVFRSTSLVQQHCAPVFLVDKCCPVFYNCPTGNETVVHGSGSIELCAGNTCQFGDMRLEVGDSLQVDNQCLQCKCSTPPLVTCKMLTEAASC